MPTYEYRCEKCNQTFEAFQSMKDQAYLVCPKNLCREETWGKGKVKRLIGAGAGFIGGYLRRGVLLIAPRTPTAA